MHTKHAYGHHANSFALYVIIHSSVLVSEKYVDVSNNLGYVLENCGVSVCGYDEIEIHVATTSFGVKEPRLCIGSK